MRCVSLENVGEFRRNVYAFHTNVDTFHINEDAFHTNFIHAFRINVDAFRRNLKLMCAHSPPPLADILKNHITYRMYDCVLVEMFCQNCGTKLFDTGIFCHNCGVKHKICIRCIKVIYLYIHVAAKYYLIYSPV